MAGNYKIPFNKNGNMMGWSSSYNANTIWVDNYEFEDTLTIIGSTRGNSSTKFIFKGSYEKRYEVFVKDMFDMCLHMINGNVTGKFTFCKRGENYGLRLTN